MRRPLLRELGRGDPGQVQVHAADAHGITEVTPELVEQVTAKIEDVPA